MQLHGSHGVLIIHVWAVKQATIMTDPETADQTYIGPMTPELVEQIIAKVSGGAGVSANLALTDTMACTKRQTSFALATLRFLQRASHDRLLSLQHPQSCWRITFFSRKGTDANAAAKRRVMQPCTQERPDAVLPTMGGQTALNLAKNLAEVRTSGASRGHVTIQRRHQLE